MTEHVPLHHVGCLQHLRHVVGGDRLAITSLPRIPEELPCRRRVVGGEEVVEVGAQHTNRWRVGRFGRLCSSTRGKGKGELDWSLGSSQAGQGGGR